MNDLIDAPPSVPPRTTRSGLSMKMYMIFYSHIRLNPPHLVYCAQYPLFIWTSPRAYIQSLGSVHAKAGHALFKDPFLGTSLLHEPRKLKNAVTKGSDYEPKSKVSNRMFFSKVLTLK